MHLVCHSDPQPIERQVVLAKFIEYTMKTETISQYKILGPRIISELMLFVSKFGASVKDSEILDD